MCSNQRHPRCRLVAFSLALSLLLALTAGCGTSDKPTAGPTLISEDAGGEDGALTMDTGSSGDGAQVDTGLSLTCTSDLECLADLKATTCAEPRCVNGGCVLKILAKGLPCKPDGLEVAVCQQTLCDGEGKCLFSPAANGKSCGDDVCGDACVDGVCIKAAANDDGNPCTQTICDNGKITHAPLPPGVNCKDDEKCVAKGTCVSGACTGAKTLCDDGITCTIDFCQPGKGCQFLPADGLCDDSNPCTQSACDAKQGCTSGPAPKGGPCDDGNACTQKDACNGVGSCAGGVNTCQCQQNSDCVAKTDGGADLCTPLACIAGACQINLKTKVVCDPTNTPCVMNVCQPSTGKCKKEATKEGKDCDDGDACSLKSACNKGTCSSTLSADCNDGDACTKDACDAKAGKCVNAKIPGCGANCQTDLDCDDTNPCTADTCATGGTCAYATQPNCTPCGSAAQCDDGDACTDDSCGATGTCQNKKKPNCAPTGCTNNAACDDKNPCTQDSCGSDGKCYYKKVPNCPVTSCANDAACDDKDSCTKDSCAANGTCVNSKIPGCSKTQCKTDADCPLIDVPCLTAYCSDAGACKITLEPNCPSGCKNNAACDDKNPCTKDTCDAKGTCQNTPIAGCKKCDATTNCADTNPCTVDACTLGLCTNKAAPGCKQCKLDKHCDDGNACTKDACTGKASNGVGKCVWTALTGGNCPQCYQASDCDDKNPCTISKCGSTGVFKGKCQFTKKSCDDKNACTYDLCDVKSGVCGSTKIPNCGAGCQSSQQCVDNSPCITSYCAQGNCKSLNKNCNDNNACTFDTCDANSGKCLFTPIPNCSVGVCKKTADCNDGDPCTYDQCSAFSGKCYNNKIPNCDPNEPKCKSAADCDDNKPCTNDYCSAFSGKCTNNKVPNCVIGLACKSSADCDDKNKCTSNPCVGSKCASSIITCNDYNPCTNDYCQSFTGKCIHTNKPGCVAEKCTTAKNCDDQNKCTLDTCLFGFCQHNLKPGCN